MSRVLFTSALIVMLTASSALANVPAAGAARIAGSIRDA